MSDTLLSIGDGSDDAIIAALIEKFMDDPDAAEALAREFGIWDTFRDTILKPLRIDIAAHDVNAFVEYVIVDPETNDFARQMPFHREWQLLMSTKNRVLIVAPRGHGKSIQVIARIVWEIGRNPNIRIKIVCAKDDKAEEVLGAIRDMIKNNPQVKEVFPHLEVDEIRGDTKNSFYVKRSNSTMRDPTVQAAGVLTSGAGGRADILLCDDVVDPRNALVNPAERQKVKDMLTQTWFSLVAATGRIIYLATPYHVLDATHYLRDLPGDVWHRWWQPAEKIILEFDENGEAIMIPDPERPDKEVQKYHKEYLWPEKWTLEALRTKRVEIGPRAYASQFLLNAMSDEDRTFAESSLAKSFNPELSHIGEDCPDNWPTYAGVDLASSLNKRAAFSVIVTLCRNPETQRLRFKEIIRKKMKFPELISKVRHGNSKHKWRLCFVESNQFQQALIDALEDEDKSIPVQSFQTSGKGKQDEQTGLPGMEVAFERGLFDIPSARFPLDSDDQSDLGLLMQELRTHPGGETKDVVMALWFAYRAAIEGGDSDFVDAYIESLGVA